MPGPLVSIVLPTHNGSRFLHSAVESCLNQSYSRLELILVDDASTDNTPETISRYMKADKRVKSVTHRVNRKLPASLNAGFALAEGELLTWTSDDNCYRKSALETMVRYLEAHREVDIIYSDASYIDADGREIGLQAARPPEELTYWNSVGACFLYRRLVADTIGEYDEGLFLAEDHEFWLRALLKFRFHHISEDLYLYRVHGGALSQSRQVETKLAVRRMLEQYLALPSWGDRSRSLAYLRLARDAAEMNQRKAAMRYLFRAARLSPRSMVTKFALPAPALIVLGQSGYEYLRSFFRRPRGTPAES